MSGQKRATKSSFTPFSGNVRYTTEWKANNNVLECFKVNRLLAYELGSVILVGIKGSTLPMRNRGRRIGVMDVQRPLMTTETPLRPDRLTPSNSYKVTPNFELPSCVVRTWEYSGCKK